jgi:hypothetical protein
LIVTIKRTTLIGDPKIIVHTYGTYCGYNHDEKYTATTYGYNAPYYAEKMRSFNMAHPSA